MRDEGRAQAQQMGINERITMRRALELKRGPLCLLQRLVGESPRNLSAVSPKLSRLCESAGGIFLAMDHYRRILLPLNTHMNCCYTLSVASRRSPCGPGRCYFVLLYISCVRDRLLCLAPWSFGIEAAPIKPTATPLGFPYDSSAVAITLHACSHDRPRRTLSTVDKRQSRGLLSHLRSRHPSALISSLPSVLGGLSFQSFFQVTPPSDKIFI